MGSFEFVSHTADLSIRLRGEGINGLWELFQAGADSLRALLFDGAQVEPGSTEHEQLTLAASDTELLLLDWLTELLIRSTVNRRAYLTFEPLDFTPTTLSVIARYVGMKPVREVKAITMHDLHITFEQGVWQAHVTVDI